MHSIYYTHRYATIWIFSSPVEYNTEANNIAPSLRSGIFEYSSNIRMNTEAFFFTDMSSFRSSVNSHTRSLWQKRERTTQRLDTKIKTILTENISQFLLTLEFQVSMLRTIPPYHAYLLHVYLQKENRFWRFFEFSSEEAKSCGHLIAKRRVKNFSTVGKHLPLAK